MSRVSEWNELGRFVKKGEKGIMILAPIVRRKAESEDEIEEYARIAGFRAAYVFDVSQTDGQELPQIGVVEGDPHEYGERLRAFASSQGIDVDYSDTIAPARGRSSRGGVK
jgi:antirestriction protein ArdC